MELPIELKVEIENRLEQQNIKVLQEKAEEISLKYRTESGTGKRLVTENTEVLSYAAVRMPATYGAVYTVMEKLLELIPDFSPKNLLDVGAGTGAGTWAISRFFDVEQVTCLEREAEMRQSGKSLMQVSENPAVRNAEWMEFDLTKDEIPQKADIIIASYVLNEFDNQYCLKAVEKLWNATNQLLVIIEPGTPVGFNEIKAIREKLIKTGGYIVAPCPHSKPCPIVSDDWCHTTCRVSRTKLHKNLKSGCVPYEDEKFSYIVFSKISNVGGVEKKLYLQTGLSRILRHPKIETGKITLDVCNANGTISKEIVTKKNKELFKKVRKSKCGDSIQIIEK